jgi:predicted RNA-binding Zn ribbon-like protein
MPTVTDITTNPKPQPVHGTDPVTPAPGDLELVRRFLSLHDHEIGTNRTFQPSPESVEWWLRTEGGLGTAVDIGSDDLAWTMRVREALIRTVRENMGEGRDEAAFRTLDEAAERAGLTPSFGDPANRFRSDRAGVYPVMGRVLAAAFLARLDDSWHRFRMCADANCTTVFYDRSKNHSAKWCSMQSCGNKNKVRSYRERHGGQP